MGIPVCDTEIKHKDAVVREAARKMLELMEATEVEALILFGSRADGRAGEWSDVDFYAFHREGGHRVWRTEALGREVRCFSYNAAVLKTECTLPEFSVVKIGIPVYDPYGMGALFLEKIKKGRENAPRMPEEAKRRLRAWIESMLSAAFLGTPEANYLRLRATVRCLEALFLLSGQIYPGEKMACMMLERDAPEAFRLYMRAISKNAGEEDVRAWANAALYRKWPVNAVDFWFGKAKEAQTP